MGIKHCTFLLPNLITIDMLSLRNSCVIQVVKVCLQVYCLKYKRVNLERGKVVCYWEIGLFAFDRRSYNVDWSSCWFIYSLVMKTNTFCWIFSQMLLDLSYYCTFSRIYLFISIILYRQLCPS